MRAQHSGRIVPVRAALRTALTPGSSNASQSSHTWVSSTAGCAARPGSGRSFEGAEQFAAKRPGWTAPVHELLRRAGATVVFHGHDHFYARQELDGVVYQLVPQPGHPGGDAAKMAAAYGYVAGEFLPSPGHLRVRVTPQTATVEYVRGGPRGPAAAAPVVKAYAVPAAAAAPVTPSK